MLANVTSLVIAKTCGLTQTSLVVTIEMCSNAILKDMSIFLTIVIAISCVLIPIVTFPWLLTLFDDHVGFDLHSNALFPYFC